MARTNVTLHASAAETETGIDGPFATEFDDAIRAVFYLDITAVSGADRSMSVRIQEQDPVSSSWFEIATFTQVKGPRALRVEVNPMYSTNVRARRIISGGSFTYTLSAVVTS